MSLFGNEIKWKIALVEGNSLITDVKVSAKTFIKFFVNAAATLGFKIKKLPFNYNYFLIPSSNENNLIYLLSSEWGKIR